MRVLNLLNELRRTHSEGVIDLPDGTTLVYEVGPRNRKEEVIDLFDGYWDTPSEEDALVVDLAGIKVIGPSAANALAGGAATFLETHKMPVAMVHAEPEALQALRDCRHVQEHPTPPLPVVDVTGAMHYVGAIPDRLKEVLRRLDESRGASASELADQADGTSRRTVNRFSVYLQELYMNGLARREKVVATAREGAERGWTYMYYPAHPAWRVWLTRDEPGDNSNGGTAIEKCLWSTARGESSADMAASGE